LSVSGDRLSGVRHWRCRILGAPSKPREEATTMPPGVPFHEITVGELEKRILSGQLVTVQLATPRELQKPRQVVAASQAEAERVAPRDEIEKLTVDVEGCVLAGLKVDPLQVFAWGHTFILDLHPSVSIEDEDRPCHTGESRRVPDPGAILLSRTQASCHLTGVQGHQARAS
jgi:hypothetical protein